MNAVAIGNLALASGTNAVAMGSAAKATGASSIAIGDNAQATAAKTISIGTGNVVTGIGSGAVGDPNTISGAGSYALGNNNTITADNAFVVGNDATASLAGAVVLGNASDGTAASKYQPTTAVTVNGISYTDFACSATQSDGAIVSVGAKGAERQLKNVASGSITAGSTDAVTGSQLYTTQTVIAETAHSTAAVIGGNASVGTNGAITASNIGGTGANTIHDAITNVGNRIDRAEKRADGGTAAAMAMGNLPQAWRPGQTGFALGGSTYRGETGYAAGLSHMTGNGRWVIKGSVAGSSRGSVGAAVGAFFSFD